jgi:hypothetical protein
MIPASPIAFYPLFMAISLRVSLEDAEGGLTRYAQLNKAVSHYLTAWKMSCLQRFTNAMRAFRKPLRSNATTVDTVRLNRADSSPRTYTGVRVITLVPSFTHIYLQFKSYEEKCCLS